MPQRLALLSEHAHAGRHCVPGDTLTLEDDLATWLIGLGVAVPLPETPHALTAIPSAEPQSAESPPVLSNTAAASTKHAAASSRKGVSS